MWRCTQCNHRNASEFDLCAKCGCNLAGDRDSFMYAWSCWRRRFVRLLLLLVILYIPSYFLFGSHSTYVYLTHYGYGAKKYMCHIRDFPFHPWIYQPVAKLECKIRGKRSQIIIKHSTRVESGGMYVFGPVF